MINVPAGKYVPACKPGMTGKGIRSDFTVTDSGDAGRGRPVPRSSRSTPPTRSTAPTSRTSPQQLLAGTKQFVAAYKAGDDAEGRALYAPARVHWERIEPVAESFGDLDPKMDLREADLEQGQKWTGWHRIEKDLWPPKRPAATRALTQAQRATYADDLLANTEMLDSAGRRSSTFTVDQIGNGSKGLLDEVATGKVTGEEEIWSHTDLYDFQANVDGARVALRGPEAGARGQGPGAGEADRSSAFAALQELLDQHQAGDGLRLLRQASPRPQRKQLSDAVNALSEPLSKMTGGRHPVTRPRASTPHAALVSRRRLLGVAGAGALAVGRGRVRRRLGAARATDGGAGDGHRPAYPFHGAHQAGIVTPAQDRLHFAAFDVTTDSRAELVALLKAWTARPRADDARAGRSARAPPLPYDAPPERHRRGDRACRRRADPDLRLRPDAVREATARTGSGSRTGSPRRCASCRTSPPTTSTRQRSNGDLCVQACADDPQVAVHAIRNLARIALRHRRDALGPARLRPHVVDVDRSRPPRATCSASRTAPPTSRPRTPRTSTSTSGSAEGDDAGADWLAGGSYLVARRINMHIETWDRTIAARAGDADRPRPRARARRCPAARSSPSPTSTVQGSDGEPLIAMDSHVRLAHPTQNNGVRMLRRGYNFTDGNDALGRLDAGLFFIAFVRDPRHAVHPDADQARPRDDGLMEYLQHTGSGLFAVPRGVRPGGYVGDTLFT